MLVILCQHGKAYSESVNPQRPLTEEGKKETEKVARFVSSFLPEVSLIAHSGKLRAEQTAEIIGKFIKSAKGIEKWDGLSPKDDPEILKGKLMKETNITSLIIVGHLPHLQRFSSLLLKGDVESKLILFENSGFVSLEGIGNEWGIKWMVTPSIL